MGIRVFCKIVCMPHQDLVVHFWRLSSPASPPKRVFTRSAGFVLYQAWFLCALAGGYAMTGQLAEGEAVVDAALQQCQRTGEAWCRPELMRMRARLLLKRGDTVVAESCLREALAESERQGALSWSLRGATDLARLAGSQGRKAEALDLLAPMRARFTEGFATPDLLAAASLLQELGAG
jgi:predicted ATPase